MRSECYVDLVVLVVFVTSQSVTSECLLFSIFHAIA